MLRQGFIGRMYLDCITASLLMHWGGCYVHIALDAWVHPGSEKYSVESVRGQPLPDAGKATVYQRQ
jgi:hypothetical protein